LQAKKKHDELMTATPCKPSDTRVCDVTTLG
jgi:hypothetical protein